MICLIFVWYSFKDKSSFNAGKIICEKIKNNNNNRNSHISLKQYLFFVPVYRQKNVGFFLVLMYRQKNAIVEFCEALSYRWKKWTRENVESELTSVLREKCYLTLPRNLRPDLEWEFSDYSHFKVGKNRSWEKFVLTAISIRY